MNPPMMLGALAIFLGLFAWSATRRFQLLLSVRGKPREIIGADGDDLVCRVRAMLVYALGQKKMPNYRAAGIAHIFIFSGFAVLLLRTLLLWGRGFDASFDFFGLLAHGTFLGDAYSVVKDVFATLVVLGASVFVYYRTIKRERRMTLGSEGLLILFIIITMMLADILYDAASILQQDAALGVRTHFIPVEPLGSTLAIVLQSFKLSQPVVTVLQHFGFWWHSLFVLIFLNILPYSKHFHIITSFPNAFAAPQAPRGQLPMIDDLEGRIEREEAIGIARIEDISKKSVLDAYTCTECGRCSDNCPATRTGKLLSPKHLMISLRDHLYASEPRLVHSATSPAKSVTPGTVELGYNAPKGAYFNTGEAVDIVPHVMHQDVIWACTTCRACEEQCPVLISFVDKIVDLRRDQVINKTAFPEELQKPFSALEVNANPWNLPAEDRAEWCQGLEIPFLAERPAAPVLYWVGCAASYDDRAKKIARATARLLQKAGVDFAILGSEERCTGDPARRGGHEYLFQLLAQSNVETLNGYEAHKKKIITACPHCFNTLFNEYPQFGGQFDVIHHSEYLLQLVREGKLEPTGRMENRIVYHDSCYLGRYNDVYDAPRDVLRAIPGVELLEVPYWTRNKGLCCGAGGAQMWMEEQNKDRVNNKRALQLIDTGADTVASGCPFCSTMLGDGLKAQQAEQIAQLDIAEVLERSVFADPSVTTKQAAKVTQASAREPILDA